mmetsp:Transcript_575/g.683  ORF Transcript_575/g.683 Transcript_575/m.683 type:complete len:86 (+) Transcript_575:53-310(+)
MWPNIRILALLVMCLTILESSTSKGMRNSSPCNCCVNAYTNYGTTVGQGTDATRDRNACSCTNRGTNYGTSKVTEKEELAAVLSL